MTDFNEIVKLQTKIYKLISRSNFGVFNQSVYDKIEELEFKLQELWGFTQNACKHWHKHIYKFKCSWIGRKFKCVKTGEEFIIPETVSYGSLFEFGNCFIDVGDGYYSRFGGEIEEIKH